MRRIFSRSGSTAIDRPPIGSSRPAMRTTATVLRNAYARSAKRPRRAVKRGSTTGRASACPQIAFVSSRRPAHPRRSASRCRRSGAAFDDAVHGRIVFDGASIEDFVILRSDRYPTYHLSVVVDDIGHGDHGRDPRRRSHLQHAEARAAVSGARRGGASLRARAAHSRGRQEALEQAAWRHVGHGVSAARVSGAGGRELPRAARVVARRRSRADERSRN